MDEANTTNGIYRRIYSGFLSGRRINAVSELAEAWYWRLQALADDYGNLRLVSWRVLSATASPIREMTSAEAERRTMELAGSLLTFYTVEGETFIHLIDFERFQPKGRNGRRFRKVPGPLGNPGESGGIQDNPGESGLIRNNPAPPIPIPIPIPILIPTNTPTETVNTKTGEVFTLESPSEPARATRKTKTTQDTPPGFERFWAAWPPHKRKEDKRGCLARWKSRGFEPMADEIVANVEAWKRSEDWLKDGGAFIPAPMVYLNRERWQAPPPTQTPAYQPTQQVSRKEKERDDFTAALREAEMKRAAQQERKVS